MYIRLFGQDQGKTTRMTTEQVTIHF